MSWLKHYQSKVRWSRSRVRREPQCSNNVQINLWCYSHKAVNMVCEFIHSEHWHRSALSLCPYMCILEDWTLGTELETCKYCVCTYPNAGYSFCWNLKSCDSKVGSTYYNQDKTPEEIKFNINANGDHPIHYPTLLPGSLFLNNSSFVFVSLKGDAWIIIIIFASSNNSEKGFF